MVPFSMAAMHIINEPIAAVVAYGPGMRHRVTNIIVYDLCVGTFDKLRDEPGR